MGRPGTTNKYDAQLCYLEIPKHVDMLSCWCLVKPNPVEICQDVSVWSLGALGTSKLWKIIKQNEHTWKHTHTHEISVCAFFARLASCLPGVLENGSVEIPKNNHNHFNITWGAWAIWGSLLGSDGSALLLSPETLNPMFRKSFEIWMRDPSPVRD